MCKYIYIWKNFVNCYRSYYLNKFRFCGPYKTAFYTYTYNIYIYMQYTCKYISIYEIMFCVHELATGLPEVQCLLYCTAYINIMVNAMGQLFEALRYRP